MPDKEILPSKVLVVEDNEELRTAIVGALRWRGFICSEAGDVARARKVVIKARPDVVILDLGLPDGDGLSFLTELRKTDNLPVLVVTGRDTEADKILGLEVGADDYITKPFNAAELAARVNAVLRRTGPSSTGKLGFGSTMLNSESREVIHKGLNITLTAKEFDLLFFLVKHPKTVFSRADLLREVWHNDDESAQATVTEHVRRLRQKIEDNPSSPRYLCAVRGVGYKLIP
jgi:DNA-binding response OmpR family regulator